MQYTQQSLGWMAEWFMQRPAKPFTPVRFRLQPPNVMKIGIIGYGFVGKALKMALNNMSFVLK